MRTKNPTPKVKKISAYAFVGLLGVSGTGYAIATDENGRKVANLFRHQERVYQTEVPAPRALFASGEWACFGKK